MGPLAGIKVVEFAALGPAPFGGMILADLGADVVRVDRAGPQPVPLIDPACDPFGRGHRSVAIDLRAAAGVDLAFGLVERADVLIEGFRPGVMERLGLGPDPCLDRNPGLVYARMTGWGQAGPLAGAAGHDVNYIALAGALHPIGRAGEPPMPPLNFVGDFGGGGMLLAMGICAALVERARSGRGQVIDAAMVDGAALMTTLFHGLRAGGRWRDERGTNAVDTGSHFYNVYETADGEHVAVGAMEPQFYAELVDRLGPDADDLPGQADRDGWDEAKARLAHLFRQRTRAEWCRLLEGTDACFAPVLSLAEAPGHPHNQARGVFCSVGGVTQPAPAPRFSRTPAAVPAPPPVAGRHTAEVLRELGLSGERIAALVAAATVSTGPGSLDLREGRPDPVGSGTIAP